MNNPTATGEWTIESASEIVGNIWNKSGIIEKLANAHNAALAAETEHLRLANLRLVDCLIWLREELKGDEYFVEKIDIALTKGGKMNKPTSDNSTIVAERENAEKAAARTEAAQIALAAEMEKHGDEMTSVQLQLHKQLAANDANWRKAMSAAADVAKQAFADKDKQLAAEREKVQMLVDALERVRDCNDVRWAKDALDKVKQ